MQPIYSKNFSQPIRFCPNVDCKYLKCQLMRLLCVRSALDWWGKQQLLALTISNNISLYSTLLPPVFNTTSKDQMHSLSTDQSLDVFVVWTCSVPNAISNFLKAMLANFKTLILQKQVIEQHSYFLQLNKRKFYRLAQKCPSHSVMWNVLITCSCLWKCPGDKVLLLLSSRIYFFCKGCLWYTNSMQ